MLSEQLFHLVHQMNEIKKTQKNLACEYQTWLIGLKEINDAKLRK